MEGVYEPSETTDSETGLLDNLYEFLVEKGEQEKAIQDTQEKRILNVAMLHLSSEGEKKCPTLSTFNSFLSEKRTTWSTLLHSALSFLLTVFF